MGLRAADKQRQATGCMCSHPSLRARRLATWLSTRFSTPGPLCLLPTCIVPEDHLLQAYVQGHSPLVKHLDGCTLAVVGAAHNVHSAKQKTVHGYMKGGASGEQQ